MGFHIGNHGYTLFWPLRTDFSGRSDHPPHNPAPAPDGAKDGIPLGMIVLQSRTVWTTLTHGVSRAATLDSVKDDSAGANPE